MNTATIDGITYRLVPITEPEPREVELCRPYYGVDDEGYVYGSWRDEAAMRKEMRRDLTPVRLRAFALDEPEQEQSAPDLDWYVRKPNGLVEQCAPPERDEDHYDNEYLSFPKGTRVSADGVPEGKWPVTFYAVWDGWKTIHPYIRAESHEHPPPRTRAPAQARARPACEADGTAAGIRWAGVLVSEPRHRTPLRESRALRKGRSDRPAAPCSPPARKRGGARMHDVRPGRMGRRFRTRHRHLRRGAKGGGVGV